MESSFLFFGNNINGMSGDFIVYSENNGGGRN